MFILLHRFDYWLLFFRFWIDILNFGSVLHKGFRIVVFVKRNSFESVTEMGCCGCFGFSFMRKPKKVMMPGRGLGNHASQESLLAEAVEDEEGPFYNGDDCEFRSPIKRSEEILMYRMQHGLICREYPVKETHNLIRSEVNCRINVVLSLHHYHLEIFSHEKYTPLLNQGKKRKKIKKLTSKAFNQMLKYIYTFRILYFCLFLFVIKNIYSVPLFGRTRVVMC